MDLSKVSARDTLAPRREPHWQRVRPGCFLGYRPSARGGAGTWIARAYDEDGRKYRLKALGDFSGLSPREMFTAAKREAEAFAETVESGGQPTEKIETVEDACRKYAEGRHDAASRFARIVYGEPIAKIALAKLRRHHLKHWRTGLESRPALVSRSKAGEPTTRPRAAGSINRDMTVLRAALNKVMAPGTPGTEAAWQEALRPIRGADKQRTLYLDRDQRKALLARLEGPAESFVRCLCLLPLRPGAVAALTVADFDKRTAELTVGKDKNGLPRRILLPQAAAALFTDQAKDKLPTAPLFMRPNGAAWNKETWKGPIAQAASAAELPAGVTAYTLRHSTITDLVNGGLPLLAVAQISGTSVEMIERHYGHLGREAASEALAALAL